MTNKEETLYHMVIKEHANKHYRSEDGKGLDTLNKAKKAARGVGSLLGDGFYVVIEQRNGGKVVQEITDFD